MNLAFCIERYFSFGGMQRHFREIVEACLKRGHQIEIYTTQWEGELIPNTVLHLLPIRAFTNHGRIEKFFKALKKRIPKGSVIIGFNKMPDLAIYFAADVCLKSKLRTYHQQWRSILPRYQLYLKFENAVFSPQSTTKILTIAAPQQADYQAAYHTSLGRFVLLPPGVRRLPPSFVDSSRAQGLCLREQDKSRFYHLIFIASKFYIKGLDRILKALAFVTEPVRLTIVGGDDQKPYAKLIKQLASPHEIKFVGSQKNVEDFLEQADLMVHPARIEAGGIVLLEALVLGVPVLTIANCGYSGYVQEAKAGIVLDKFDPELFRSALNSLLNREKLAEFRKNALHYAKSADIYSLGERAADAIEEIAHVD